MNIRMPWLNNKPYWASSTFMGNVILVNTIMSDPIKCILTDKSTQPFSLSVPETSCRVFHD